MKIAWLGNVLTVVLCAWILVELRAVRSERPETAEWASLRSQLEKIADRQMRMEVAVQASRDQLTELGRKGTEEQPEEEHAPRIADDPDWRSLAERLERIEAAVQERPGPNWTREIYPGSSWAALERRAPRLVPYEEFRALRPGTPYHVVVDRLGLPARMVGSLADELVLLYADPETADEFVEVEIGGGVLVSITGVPKQ